MRGSVLAWRNKNNTSLDLHEPLILLEAERTDKKQTKKENIGEMINVMEKSKARLVL